MQPFALLSENASLKLKAASEISGTCLGSTAAAQISPWQGSSAPNLSFFVREEVRCVLIGQTPGISIRCPSLLVLLDPLGIASGLLPSWFFLFLSHIWFPLKWYGFHLHVFTLSLDVAEQILGMANHRHTDWDPLPPSRATHPKDNQLAVFKPPRFWLIEKSRLRSFQEMPLLDFVILPVHCCSKYLHASKGHIWDGSNFWQHMCYVSASVLYCIQAQDALVADSPAVSHGWWEQLKAIQLHGWLLVRDLQEEEPGFCCTTLPAFPTKPLEMQDTSPGRTISTHCLQRENKRKIALRCLQENL